MRLERWLYTVPLRVRSLLRGERADLELDEEIEDHLARRAEQHEGAGMTAEEARRAAIRELGGTLRVREQCRDTRRVGLLLDFAQDARHGLRRLRKSPGFSAVAILTLALGIGANTAIFTIIDAVMLRPLPLDRPERLAVFKWSARHWPRTTVNYNWSGCPVERSVSPQPAPVSCSLSQPAVEQLRAARDAFEGVAAFVPARPIGATVQGRTGLVQADLVSGDFFATLRLRAARGRALQAGDDEPGAPAAVLVSHAYWRNQLAADPAVVGRSILLNGVAFTVVGVTPPAFVGLDPGQPRDMWLPLSSPVRLQQKWPAANDARSVWLLAIARLKDGVSVAQAQAAAQVAFHRSVVGDAKIFQQDDDPRLELKSAATGLASLRKAFSQPLFVLMAAVGLVLLIACANVATLLLARAAAQRREMAVRLALGAPRGRIARQVMTESLVLAAVGGALGVLLAYAGARSLATFLAASSWEGVELGVGPSLHILGFTAATTLATALLFGLAPALRVMAADLAPLVKDSARVTRPRWHRRRGFGLGNGLVAVQVALAIPVLAAALLVLRTLVNLRSVDLGFEARNVLLFTISPALSGYEGERLANVYAEVQRRVGAVPGVRSVSCSATALLSGSYVTQDFYLGDASQQAPEVSLMEVGAGFFETMGIPIVGGRFFGEDDSDAPSRGDPRGALVPQRPPERPVPDRHRVAVVNEAFARRFYGTANPIGRRIGFEKQTPADTEIVGVVRDSRYLSLRKAIEPAIYVPLPPGRGLFEVRTSVEPASVIGSVRRALADLDPNLPVSGVTTQTELIDRSIYQERLVARLAGGFGALSVLLACIGLYGLLSYEVAGRRSEIGIRMALGARPRDVVRLVVRRGLWVAASGAVIGLVVASLLTRSLARLLYGVTPADPVTLASVLVLLLAVASVASYLPARRAAAVDPMLALRRE